MCIYIAITRTILRRKKNEQQSILALINEGKIMIIFKCKKKNIKKNKIEKRNEMRIFYEI